MTRQQKKTLKMALSYLVIVLIGCLLLFPIAWMISCAFKTNEEIFGSIALLPKSFSLQNFVDGWKSAGSYTYLTYFLNSFALVVPTTVLTIASSALVAYGFARFEFPFKKQLWLCRNSLFSQHSSSTGDSPADPDRSGLPAAYFPVYRIHLHLPH